MGSPDLPSEENDITRPTANSLPMHGGNTTASDDSDMEMIDTGYLGYQPLNLDEETMEYRNDSNDQENDDDADDDFDYSVCIFHLNSFHCSQNTISNCIYMKMFVAGFQCTNHCPRNGNCCSINRRRNRKYRLECAKTRIIEHRFRFYEN